MNYLLSKQFLNNLLGCLQCLGSFGYVYPASQAYNHSRWLDEWLCERESFFLNGEIQTKN